MGDRARRRGGVVGFALLAMVAVSAAGAVAQEAGEPVDLGSYATPLRFHAPEGTVFELASGERYVGTLEVRLAPGGGLTVVNAVPMETYVEGIAEMPAGWPMEALKAQAVAARTYAWFELEQGRWGRFGFDVCASTACQVFRGRDVVETPGVGQRWERAVAETAGEALTYEGEPILARYFSTSGGATRNNEHVFPGEGPRPYLKGVDDPDDAVSPLHRWTATFTREQMDAILAEGERLSATVPMRDITHLTSPGGGADRVRVAGVSGEVVEVGASQFRSFVSAVAEELYPDEYPQERPDGVPLPTTLPSSRFEVEVSEDAVRIDGRGWGHGVGMGQFGAMGKAERGLDHTEILSAYYNGLEPARPAGLPERIRVGLTTDAVEVALSADGPFRVESGDVTITPRGLGGWTVSSGPDATMRLVAPSGYGAPLVVAPTTSSRQTPYSVEVIAVDTVVNKPSELSLAVTDRSDGEVVLARPLGVVEAGRHDATWDLDDADGQQVPPGTYDVRLVAVDEESTSAGEPTTVEVVAPEPPAGQLASLLGPVPELPPSPGLPWVVLAAFVGLVGGALVGGRVGVSA